MLEQEDCHVDWYRVPIDPEKLRELNERSDLRGFIQAFGFLFVTVASGVSTWFAWQQWSWLGLIIAFTIHSNICIFMINAVHELVHGTVFKTKWLNNFFCGIFAWIGMINHRHFWASHAEHHKYTLNQPCDQEVILPIHFSFKDAIDSFKLIRFKGSSRLWKHNFKIAFGKLDGDWDQRILADPKRLKSVRNWSRIVLLSHLTILIVCVAMKWWLIPFLTTFHYIGSSVLFFFLNNTQHVGLVDRTNDFRLNCRSFHLNPFASFLYWDMNYHIEHHMYAGVPCYNLRKLHKEIQKDLPYTFKGIVDCWYHIIGVLYRQKEDPTYEYVPRLPSDEGFDPTKPQEKSFDTSKKLEKNNPIVSHSGAAPIQVFKVWECSICGFIYNEAIGMPEEGIAPGTAWDAIPDDWSCPDCGVSKADFEMREITGQVASIALEHDKEKPVVIIGSGLAGYTLARELRRLNEEQKIVIVTKDDGAYYPKPKLSTALAENKSSDDLVHKTASEMEEDLNISVKTFSWVEEIKPSEQAIIVNGESIPYHKLVVASGARPRDIGLQGDGAKDVLRINNLSDYRKFRDQLSAGDHVFIIGAGLIGCEFMNDLNHAGYQVSICDPSEAPLASLIPTEVGQDLANFYSERGISFYMKTAVASIDKTENGYVVELESGETIEVNLVLSAVGLVANTGLVKAAGIHTEKGIVVNEHLQSSDEHIYALGDCVQIDGRLLPYIAPINHAAKAIAQSLTGEQKEVSFPVMPVQIKTTQFPILVLGFSDPKKPWEIKRTEDGILAQQLNDDQKIIAAVLVKAATKELQAIIKQMN